VTSYPALATMLLWSPAWHPPRWFLYPQQAASAIMKVNILRWRNVAPGRKCFWKLFLPTTSTLKNCPALLTP